MAQTIITAPATALALPADWRIGSAPEGADAAVESAIGSGWTTAVVFIGPSMDRRYRRGLYACAHGRGSAYVRKRTDRRGTLPHSHPSTPKGRPQDLPERSMNWILKTALAAAGIAASTQAAASIT